MKKKNIIIILIIILILLIAIISVLYFVYKNTPFLTLRVEEGDIAKNNQNIEIFDHAELIELKPQKLNVPPQYRISVLQEDRVLNLPQDFEISVYIAGLSSPRFFDFDENNNLIVADKGANKIFLIKDNDNNGIADEKIEVDAGLRVPHSVDFYQGDLYTGEEHQISVYRNFMPNGSYDKKDIIVPDLPAGSGHSTRTVLVGPDNKLYVSIGSSCNVCEEEDARRAAVVQYNLDGSGKKIFARGLRNSVGIEFNEDKLWSVDNGRDLIGNDLPPEEVNIIKEGKHYGWPYCYGKGFTNPEYSDQEEFCKSNTEYPTYEMQAHSAPLGISFLPASSAKQKVNFPSMLKNNLFIGFHGSWNRTIPTGYKVVRIDVSQKENKIINFVTGWLGDDGQAWGRPVDVGFDKNGIMYISDDKAGAIYQVKYKK